MSQRKLFRSLLIGAVLTAAAHPLCADAPGGTTTSIVPASNHNGTATTAIALLTGTAYKTVTGNTTFNSDDLVGKFTYQGDANLDGILTVDDYLALNLGYLFGLRGWTHGDFAQTGLAITPQDYALLDNSYQHQSGKLADDQIALHTQWFGPAYTDALNVLNTNTPIPEPATLSLLTLAAATLLTRPVRTSRFSVRSPKCTMNNIPPPLTFNF